MEELQLVSYRANLYYLFMIFNFIDLIKLLNSYCTELYKGTCDSLYSGWEATPEACSTEQALVNARQISLYPQHKFWQKLALLKSPQYGGLSPSW